LYFFTYITLLDFVRYRPFGDFTDRYDVFKLQSCIRYKRKTASLSGYVSRPITGVWLWPLIFVVYLY
jgi:hypothetical protein